MKPRLIFTLVAFAAMLPASRALAQDTGMCPPKAGGVPFWSPRAPMWRDFGGAPPTAACTTSSTTAGVTTDCHHDDPRWRGAAALSYTSASGSANPPVQFRSVWSDEGGARFMYLQWTVRVGIFGVPGNNHDLFLAYERPGAAGFPIDHKRAHLVKIHVAPVNAAGLRNSTPVYCDPDSTTCVDTDDYYTIYVNSQIDDGGGTGTPEVSSCTGITGQGLTFRARAANEPWIDGALQVQRQCDGATCDLWVVSLRVPVVPANAATVDPFSSGIEEGSKFWYQVDLRAASLSAELDSWPRLADPAEVENPTCFVNASNERYVQRDLDSAAGWSQLTLWDAVSARPADCYDGFSLRPDDVGVISRDFGTAAPTNPTILSSSLDYRFKAFTGGTTRATNRVVARTENFGDVRSNVRLKARFRFAEWGAQAHWGTTGPGPTAKWVDVPGSAADGVCATTGVPAPGGGTCDPIATVNMGDRVPISFDWSLGGVDATITVEEATEYCVYGLTPPTGFTCNDCTITAPNDGTRADDGVSPTASCKRKLWDHQCMLVELGADSAETFENQSVYKNMNIRQMSEVAREATISVLGLPPIPGARDEAIYLVVMPRNIDASLPAGTTGVSLVAANAAVARNSLLRPFLEAAAQMDDAQYAAAVERVRSRDFGGAGYGGLTYGGLEPDLIEVPPKQLEFPRADLPRGADLAPRGLRRVAEFLDGASRWTSASAELFTEQTIASLDDITATAIVPTVDVYAFRKGTGSALLPMTSFTLVVHHDGPLHGITWTIDGATRVSDNVFRVDMPVGHKRDVKIRVMAKERSGETQQPGDPRWPCSSGGGCCHSKRCSPSQPDLAFNYGIPVLFAGVVLTSRRRRKRKGAGGDPERDSDADSRDGSPPSVT
jgi:hypothetical protein